MIYALIFIIIILLLDIIVNRKNRTTKEELMENSCSNYSTLYEKKVYLLTQKELKFYKLIKQITNKYNLNLFTQVALYEIVKREPMTLFLLNTIQKYFYSLYKFLIISCFNHLIN